MRPTKKPHQDAGFTLVEVMVALLIMAIVGLMAWRGMDSLIRGRENIEGRAKKDAVYLQLVHQFERDCQEMLPSTVLEVPQYAAGNKNIWWLRRYSETNPVSWIIVGYGASPIGLQRWMSRSLLNKSEALAAWQSILRDPDFISSEMKVSLEVSEIISQQASVITNDPLPGKGNGAPLLAGLNIRWGLKNIPFPITRSCLAGTSL
ncbi:type II secretion system protein J [Polynucleobacter sp. AP-Melu-500A-A1]|uniref:PulJ/GspJ family protein n=1 Tax=Polynucleobacter sp. AP-Melu-500A-A1 TaxID=2576929 RepID=UPI001C0D7F84|nr:prepilin-type N-terminal cleavage/methylation domain-containing protein [Polynucleobacter sp. AP-Melu-500A-A1]MBU3630713.1 prepilin-type N-terminal cleavage/methylation domain-containing protein [Polynucleobacter sp. AP-Melu-500A-A1]